VKCINKRLCPAIAAVVATVVISGCGNNQNLINAYNLDSDSPVAGISASAGEEYSPLFAEDLCIVSGDIPGAGDIDMTQAEAAALFDIDSRETMFSKNAHEKLYPASITKILTALTALKRGNLEDVITVTENALITESGAQLCGFRPGDQLTLEQALYALLIYSGNDAGIAIAEHISGSVEEFAKAMNEEAVALGATNSNFVNPHGLHDDNHYTTAYDLYLIFQEVVKYDKFVEIINTPAYTMSYTLSDGTSKEVTWNTTNHYLKGTAATPEGVTVIGGKTGTTEKAGACLILFSKNAQGTPFISVVLKSDDRTTLYSQMTDLLEDINK